jgi:hypothetical protein
MSDKGSDKPFVQVDAISGADLNYADVTGAGLNYAANFEAPGRGDVTGAGGDANLGHQGPTIPDPPRSDVTGAGGSEARADVMGGSGGGFAIIELREGT